MARTSLCSRTMTTLSCAAIMDRLGWWIWMLIFSCLCSLDSLSTDIPSYGHIFPNVANVEIGKEFTATCVLNDKAVGTTVEDLYWTLGKQVIPKERYTKINATALNVTITVNGQEQEWLICICKKYLPMLSLEQPYSIHGIPLIKAYFPEKPENLSCVALQSGRLVSSVLRCMWNPAKRDTGSTYTLSAKRDGEEQVSAEVESSYGSVQFGNTFPHSFVLDVWVEVKNNLGMVESDHLIQDAETFVKPNAPLNVSLISETSLSKSLLLKWNHPIKEAYLKLHYQVRYCPSGSALWTQVPQEDTSQYIQSFRLQSLLSDTEYVAQVRCQGNWPTYWSDWTQNVTARTPEDKPSSKPDLWRIIRTEEAERTVELLCKPPVQSNGRIRSYQLKVKKGGKEEGWRSIPLNGSERHSDSVAHREISDLGVLTLTEREYAIVKVIAHNSVGSSPEGVLIIPKIGHELSEAALQVVQCSSLRGKLWVEWRPPVANPRHNVTEYMVEWLSVSDDNRVDWQREPAGTNRTAIKGNLEKFKLYTVQVYPVYYGRPGRPASCQAYLEEAAPSAAPSMGATKRWVTEVQLDWKEIPLHQRRGFITNYTLFIADAVRTLVIPLSSNTYSYKVTHLQRDTKYVAHIMASNSQGSYNGSLLIFTTEQYGEWELEGIVVGSCFSFLAVVVLTMLFCIAKKDLIRKAFWPQVPDPSESTIAAWSPDVPSKATSSKESVLGALSVVEVSDRGSLYEDDKASLPLKDKDLSGGEHSSGIGGSSCMSSPRQSVSDSEEGDGGGSGQTTASTVQYSSVVASSGYKGQSPGAPPVPQQHQTCFARSESTQPLLEGEERPPDTPIHAQPRNPSFRRLPGDSEDADQLEMEQQRGGASLKFSPLEEGCPQTTPIEEELPPEWQASGSNYRSQANGYRPQ